MRYEMQMVTKLDNLFFQSSGLPQASKIKLFKNQSGQEWSKILTILMLSLQNSLLAGYMLSAKPVDVSGNWWQLSLAVSLSTSSFTTSYNKPVLRPDPDTLRGPNSISDPITWQTHQTAKIQNCTDRIKNLFQSDMVQEGSWYTPTPGETGCVRAQRCFTSSSSLFSWISRCRNVP